MSALKTSTCEMPRRKWTYFLFHQKGGGGWREEGTVTLDPFFFLANKPPRKYNSEYYGHTPYHGLFKVVMSASTPANPGLRRKFRSAFPLLL